MLILPTAYKKFAFSQFKSAIWYVILLLKCLSFVLRAKIQAPFTEPSRLSQPGPGPPHLFSPVLARPLLNPTPHTCGLHPPSLLLCTGGALAARSCPTLATAWTVALQAPLSMGFSRQEFWSGVPFPSPGKDLSNFQRFPERNISQPVPAVNYPFMKDFSLFNLNLLPLKKSTLCRNYSNKF